MLVLVAGDTGLAGSAISQYFSSLGHEVVGANRRIIDLTNLEDTNAYIKKIKPDLIVDAAAYVGGINANRSFPVDFFLNNISIQNNLMLSAYRNNISKFVFLGSSCIYPKNSVQPIKEEYLLTGPLEETNSAYSIAKIAGIELIKAYRKQFGMKWISLMPTNLYGPRDNFNLETAHVLPSLIRKFITAKKNSLKVVTLWGDGSAKREFLHTDDLARAVYIAQEKYDNDLPLNVGTGIDLTIKDLSILISQIVGFSGEVKWDTNMPNGTLRKVLDVSRLKSLGWNPEISLHEGISDTINWYVNAIKTGEVRL